MTRIREEEVGHEARLAAPVTGAVACRNIKPDTGCCVVSLIAVCRSLCPSIYGHEVCTLYSICKFQLVTQSSFKLSTLLITGIVQ